VFKEASWDSAVVNLEKAVALDPGRIYHRLELAHVYADRKRYDEARAQLAEVESLPEREIRDSAYRREAGALAAKLADER
jgi:thioredoxin-like negative regulator of GroEL